MNAICCAMVILGLGGAFAQREDVPTIPQQIGAYAISAGKVLPLSRLQMAGGGMKHAGKMFVPGLTPQVVYLYNGAAATTRLSASPTFYVRTGPVFNGRDYVIVRFDAKKDHRELQTTRGGTMLTFKSGFSRERAPDCDVTQVADGLYLISPKAPLPAGEYLVTMFPGTSGYEFGVDTRK